MFFLEDEKKTGKHIDISKMEKHIENVDCGYLMTATF